MWATLNEMIGRCKSPKQLKQILNEMIGRCKSPKQLKQMHAHILRRNSNQQHLPSTLTHLLLTCASCSPPPNISYSLSLFNHLQPQDSTPNAFLWNTIIRVLTLSNSPSQALSLYAKMRQRDIPQSTYTLTFTLKACTHLHSLPLGQTIHTQVVKTGLGSHAPHVHSALMHMYAQFGLITFALKVFDEMPKKSPVAWSVMISAYAGIGELGSCWGLFDVMPQRDVTSWNAMISACLRCRQPGEALRVFRSMEAAGFSPNHITLLAALSACGEVGDLELGRWIHSHYVNNGTYEFNNIRVKTALIDMYSKCGHIDVAMDVFDGIEGKDTCVWTAIICGMAFNGQGDKALALFDAMEKAKVRPDEVTFIAALCACSHAGLVKEGRRYFKSMMEDYGLVPKMEHYGCMVTIMGRAGYLQEARWLIETMPMEPNAVVWRSLLGVCSMHGATEMAEWAAKQLEGVERGRDDDDSFVMLSNVYAEDGRWSDVERVRMLMKEMGRKKRWGSSSVHV